MWGDDKMSLLGRAILEYNYSAYEHYEFTGLDDPICYVRTGSVMRTLNFGTILLARNTTNALNVAGIYPKRTRCFLTRITPAPLPCVMRSVGICIKRKR